jgi:HlyD family secretion protein
VRLAPQTVQNVVTYTAAIDVANQDLKLKPGMTANVTVLTARRENVLAVANSALRFRPATAQGADNAPRNPGVTGRRPVWKIDGQTLTPVRVELGITDGVNTEIVSGNLAEGDKVATPAAAAGARNGKAPAASSPFPTGGGGRRGYGR